MGCACSKEEQNQEKQYKEVCYDNERYKYLGNLILINFIIYI